eukprot:scaffold9150_cov120-Isochrysis_galbana.AAC.20
MVSRTGDKPIEGELNTTAAERISILARRARDGDVRRAEGSLRAGHRGAGNDSPKLEGDLPRNAC